MLLCKYYKLQHNTFCFTDSQDTDSVLYAACTGHKQLTVLPNYL